MSLEVDILSNDQLGPTATRIAAALLDVAAHEEKIAKLSDKLGISFKQAASAVDSLKKSEAQRTSNADKARAKEISDAKRQIEERRKILLTASGIAAAFAAGTVAATALGFAIANMAKTAGDARNNAQALAGSWTGGDGPRTLRILDNLAQQLGEKFGDVRAQFVKFREAGLDNKMSAHLIKLRADLVAVGLSAEEADKQIAPVLSAKGAKQQAAYIAQIAKNFGVAGDGALAAKVALTSVDAALNKLDNAKTRVLEQLWQQIGPSIGKAANQIVAFVTEAINSKEGQAVIKGIGDAFVWVANAVKPTLEFIREHKTLIAVGLVAAFGALAAAVAAIAAPFAVAYAGAALLVVKMALIGAAIGAAVAALGVFAKAVYDNWQEIKKTGGELFEIGANAVQGFIDGVKSKITAAVDTVKNLARNVSEPFAKALGIQSPSKLFAEYGKNTVEGYEQGQERALGGSMPIQSAASKAPSGGTAAGTSVSVVIERLIVNGGDGSTETAGNIRDEIIRALEGVMLSRGFA